jgi:hypothetical protein
VGPFDRYFFAVLLPAGAAIFVCRFASAVAVMTLDGRRLEQPQQSCGVDQYPSRKLSLTRSRFSGCPAA